jgi:hypothetical protein
MSRRLSDDDSDDSIKNYNWADITTTLELTSVAAVVLLILFECKRNKRSVFWPKRKYLSSHTPPEMPAGLFGWVRVSFMMGGEELLSYVGLDAYMMLR